MEDDTLFTSAAVEASRQLGLSLEESHIERMLMHYKLLVACNREINLTRITQPVEAAVKHYADSLAVVAWLEQAETEVRRVVDIGTGGGFPAIPLAIFRPDWQVTAIDGTGKKIRCVQSFIAELGLENCLCLHRRAEHWAEGTGSAELVVCRAVGNLTECLTYAKRLCDKDGILICYKGRGLPEEERTEARRVARKLGFEHRDNWSYQLACGEVTIGGQLCCYERRQG